MKRLAVIVAFTAFVLTVYGANWSLATWGIVHIGFGLSAPAGVFFAGLAFTLRDTLHEAGNRYWVIAAILVGAGLSALLEDARLFALASGTAFLLSEGADLLVYSPLRARGWLRAVLASNVVGFTVDSMLFLWIAFGSLEYLTGQVVGKFYMTLGAILILGILRWIFGSAHTCRTGSAQQRFRSWFPTSG